MEAFITIQRDINTNLHSYFFVISFVSIALLMLYKGYKRKYPIFPYIVLISAMFTFAIIGGKLLSFNSEDWQ